MKVSSSAQRVQISHATILPGSPKPPRVYAPSEYWSIIEKISYLTGILGEISAEFKKRDVRLCVFGYNNASETTMIDQIPPQPPKSFRIVLELPSRISRMDNTLLAALKDQSENLNLKEISRQTLKKLFIEGKIQIKGQRAKPSSALAKGITYVDVLGF